MRMVMSGILTVWLAGCGGHAPGDKTALAENPVTLRIADLKNNDGAVRTGAARALGNMGVAAGPATQALLETLRGDADPAIRREAAWALARIGAAHKEMVPFLIDMLADRSEEICGGAAVALGKIGPEAKAAVAPLIGLLKAGNTLKRKLAAEALGEIGPAAKAAVPVLIEALNGDPLIRRVAAEALEQIDPGALKRAKMMK
jgi:HEAT repeat protein